ncbi:hypothetical protein CaCOL14_005307 [Colletotrichum acutatum]
MPSMRLIVASLWAHITAFANNTVRMTLLALIFTSTDWTNFYTRFASDYSRVAAAEFHLRIMAESTSVILHILVQVSLEI